MLLHSSKKSLFVASCFALVVTSMTFSVRAGIIETLGKDFGLTNTQLGWIVGTAFWGFPIAVVLGGILTEIMGMKKMIFLAFFGHFFGIILTVLSGGFWSLFFSTLLIGMANGMVEAACNPLIATIYPKEKITKLNLFHLWFPGGLVIGGLIVFLFKKIELGWQAQTIVLLAPTIVYGIIFAKKTLPKTERIKMNISSKEMYASLGTPLFIFLVICMFMTAITELGTNQWIAVLLSNVTQNSILLLVFVSGIMVIGRAFAKPILSKISSTGVLLISAVFSAFGLYLIGSVEGSMIFLATAIFAVGITFFWPTMLGTVSEYIPKSGSVGLAVIGGAGMLAVSIFQPFIGGLYDAEIVLHLPTKDLEFYRNAIENTNEYSIYREASLLAGPGILKKMAFLPCVLIVLFSFLHFNKKSFLKIT